MDMEFERANRLRFARVDFENANQMWASIASLLSVLDRAGHVAVITGERDSVLVDFNSRDPESGCALPYWLFDDEIDQINMLPDYETYEEIDFDFGSDEGDI